MLSNWADGFLFEVGVAELAPNMTNCDDNLERGVYVFVKYV